MVSIGTSLFFAEISGSAVADAAALGSILIPAMKSRGYSKEFAASVISSSATLAVIIPPSIPMLLYAVIAGTSVVKLFVSGIVPGILGGLGMMGVAYWFARRYNFPVEQSFRWANVRKTFREALWAFLLPVIILGSIFGGIVTATEGAAIAVLAALFVGFVVYRELDVHVLRTSIVEGGMQTAVVMLLVAASALLGRLSHRDAPAAAAGAGHPEFHGQQMGGAGDTERAVPDPRLFPALGRGDHPGGAGRHAAGHRRRHRPGSLRADRDASTSASASRRRRWRAC